MLCYREIHSVLLLAYKLKYLAAKLLEFPYTQERLVKNKQTAPGAFQRKLDNFVQWKKRFHYLLRCFIQT